MWKRLTHPNIVPFKGVTLDPLRIVSVWMPGGDLTAYITRNPQTNRLNLVSQIWRLLKNMCLVFCELVDVAKGLQYLHLSDVIHGDLKGVSLCHCQTFRFTHRVCSPTFWSMVPAVHVLQISALPETRI